MKKTLIYFSVIVLLISLTACNGQYDSGEEQSSTTSIEETSITESNVDIDNVESVDKKSNTEETYDITTEETTLIIIDTDSDSDGSTTSESPWNEGQVLPDMPIE